ncbi:cyclic GMP-AMP synthase-like [Branchiostoma floridae]|uniref:Cyclic GMP-AMP synthase-like n=1 Tax=Branchiostoma floridae TaxID=7739 RepID=A0A9J7LXA5_BRAFL|nr:cyclic GMP-AMP synthase-like [Branchiostoma floridae]
MPRDAGAGKGTTSEKSGVTGKGSGKKSPDEAGATGKGSGRKSPDEAGATGKGSGRKSPDEAGATGKGSGRKTPGKPGATGKGSGRKTPKAPAATVNGSGRKTPKDATRKGSGKKSPDEAGAAGKGSGKKTPDEAGATVKGRGRKTPDESGATVKRCGKKTPDEAGATGKGSCKKSPDVAGPAGKGSGRKSPVKSGATGNDRGFQTKLKKAIDNLVRVPQTDRSETAKIYNPIVRGILEEIKKIAVTEGESDIFRLQQLNSGSYFENLKVDTTNEFDFMFCIYGEKLVVQETEPDIGMVAVKLLKSSNSSLRKYLTPDGFLSPKKLLSRFRSLVERAVDTLSRAGAESPFRGLQFELTPQKDGCPAVTLMVAKKRLQISIDLVLALVAPPPWPKCTKEWKNGVTLWPNSRDIRKIKKNELHLVAKAAPPGKDPGGNKLWRLSFSQAEKDIFSGKIINPTDASHHAKTCRKDCLRCLKYIKLQLTGGVARDVDFASYHLKTVLLHAIVKQPNGWENDNLVTCIVYVIDELVQCIIKRHLPHFFIPGYNLFDPAVFRGLRHLDAVKNHFLRVKEDLMNGRLPEELNALAMPVH